MTITVGDLVALLRPIREAALSQTADPDCLQAGIILSTLVASLLTRPVDRAALAALAQTAGYIAREKLRDRADGA